MLVGYGNRSTDPQDLTAQGHKLIALGGTPHRVSVEHGPTGTTRAHWWTARRSEPASRSRRGLRE
jgi:hypothetical protein